MISRLRSRIALHTFNNTAAIQALMLEPDDVTEAIYFQKRFRFPSKHRFSALLKNTGPRYHPQTIYTYIEFDHFLI